MENAEDDVPKLPSQIICLEILPRLPAKSLMRFRCVCKSWFDFITSNPLFQSIHLKYHPHNTHILLEVLDFFISDSEIVDQKRVSKHYFLFVKDSQKGITPSQVTDCVKVPQNLVHMYYANGLVLGYCGQYGVPIFVVNPFTRKSISIPDPAEPNISWISSEEKYFGFSPRTNEYKIILAKTFQRGEAYPPSTTLFMLKVFTLGTGLWRNLEVDWDALSLDPLQSWDFHRTKSVCVHGAIHWLTSNQDAILALDVADERFRVIPLPQVEADDMLQIIEVDGCLAVVCDWKLQQMVLWILKDYEKQVWVKETIKSFPPGYPVVKSPQCTIHTGELLFDSRRHKYQDNLHLYDMKTRRYRMSPIISPKLLRQPYFRSFSTSFSPCIVPFG